MARISHTLTGVPAGLNKLVSHNQHITSAPCKANNLSPVPMPNQPPAEMHAATAQPQLTPNSRTKLNTRPQQTLSNKGSKATQPSEDPIASKTSPSHHNKYHWLVALLKHLQNTAWDKWKSYNGIQDSSWRNLELPVGPG